MSKSPRFNPRPGSKPAPPPPPPRPPEIGYAFRLWLDVEIRQADLSRAKVESGDEAVGISAWIAALQRVRAQVFGSELEL